MQDSSQTIRIGEATFPVDPAASSDACLAFIGSLASPWADRRDCPKNMRQAREHARPAAVHVDAEYRLALAGLESGQWIVLLTWLHEARRDLALQTPRHTDGPRGTFSLRSPVRPNPIGLHLVRIVAIDAVAGRIDIDAIDVLDGTPLLDIKPFLVTVDAPHDRTAGRD